jgi:hypothetical protein
MAWRERTLGHSLGAALPWVRSGLRLSVSKCDRLIGPRLGRPLDSLFRFLLGGNLLLLNVLVGKSRVWYDSDGAKFMLRLSCFAPGPETTRIKRGKIQKAAFSLVLLHLRPIYPRPSSTRSFMKGTRFETPDRTLPMMQKKLMKAAASAPVSMQRIIDAIVRWAIPNFHIAYTITFLDAVEIQLHDAH